PSDLQDRVLTLYSHIDVIENRERAPHELVIDHRFPMERWGKAEDDLSSRMSDNDIKRKFQLLKFDQGGNHNLLKSRACEKCISTGQRGAPLGIKFFYEGNESWPNDIPSNGSEAEQGCIGCGWYDFAQWREKLNQHLSS
ncbi:MAG: hypothetical protein MK183_08190, partial [Verrucomicrobiales bacterium]|nr:hypothetical protein [Verrucomicrobiales bacterium]